MATPEESPATRVRAQRPPREPDTIVLVISGPLTRAHIRGLSAFVRLLLEGCDSDHIVCDVGGLVEPDAATVDALARFQLAARRLGRRVRLRHPSSELQELLALMGLSEVIPLCGGLTLESKRQAEQREKSFGVQEEGEPGDPTA